MSETKFIAIVKSKKCKNEHGYGSERGDTYVVMKDTSGYVPASSCKFNEGDNIPLGAKTFDTKQAAQEFVRNWSGHPWWVSPYKNDFDVIEVKALYEPKQIGWKPA